MKTEFKAFLNNDNLYKSEYLTRLLTNLDQLDAIKLNIFNSININLSHRLEKLQNLRSRINRIKEIISTFGNFPQALTIKSKRQYPTEEYQYFQNVFLNENPNIEQLQNDKVEPPLLSPTTIESLQDEELLNRPPKGSFNDALITHMEFLLAKSYQDISNILYTQQIQGLGYFQGISNDEVEEINSEYTTSSFSYSNKMKIKTTGAKKIIVEDKNYIKESALLTKFDKRVTKNKPIQDAPISITENKKLEQYKKRKSGLPRNKGDDFNLDINIPSTLNLNNIAQINPSTAPIEEYFKEEDVQVETQQHPIDEEELDQGFNGELDGEEGAFDWFEHRKTFTSKQNTPNPTQTQTQTFNNTQTTTNPPPSTTTTQPTQPTQTTSTTQFTSTVKMEPAKKPGGSIPVPPPLPPVALPKPKAQAPPKEPPKEKPKEPPKDTSKDPVQPDDNADKEKAENDKDSKGEEEKEEEKPKGLSMEEEIALAKGKLKKVDEAKKEEKDPKNEPPKGSAVRILLLII